MRQSRFLRQVTKCRHAAAICWQIFRLSRDLTNRTVGMLRTVVHLCPFCHSWAKALVWQLPCTTWLSYGTWLSCGSIRVLDTAAIVCRGWKWESWVSHRVGHMAKPLSGMFVELPWCQGGCKAPLELVCSPRTATLVLRRRESQFFAVSFLLRRVDLVKMRMAVMCHC